VSDGTYRLSPWQMAVLTFILSLCVTPFGFPGIVDRQLGRYGWLAAVPATAIGLWGTLLAVDLSRRFPGRPFDRIAVDLLGPIPGFAYVGALALLMAAGAAVNLQIWASVDAATELTHLPLAYPAVMTAGLGVLAVHYGPEVVARVAEVLAPFIGAGLAAIFLSAFADAHPGRLLPLGDVPWSRFLSPDLLAAGGTIRGFLVLLVLGPFCRPRPRAGPLCAVAAGAGTLVAASLALPVLLFGAGFTAELRYPFLTAVGTITWQWLPVHHLVVVTMMVWHAIALVVFAAYLWLGAWLLRRLWPRLPWLVAVLGLAAVDVTAAAWPTPGDLAHAGISLWNDAVVLLGVVTPTLLWLRARQHPPVLGHGRTLP
jgi:spore germination protein KB